MTKIFYFLILFDIYLLIFPKFNNSFINKDFDDLTKDMDFDINNKNDFKINQKRYFNSNLHFGGKKDFNFKNDFFDERFKKFDVELKNFANVKDSFKVMAKAFNLHFNKFEKQFRLKIFEKNFKKVKKHNKYKSDYKMGLNQFSFLSNKEFRSQYLPKPTPIKPFNPNHKKKKKKISTTHITLKTTVI